MYPKKYVPKRLSKKDRSKQKKMLEKSKSLYYQWVRMNKKLYAKKESSKKK